MSTQLSFLKTNPYVGTKFFRYTFFPSAENDLESGRLPRHNGAVGYFNHSHTNNIRPPPLALIAHPPLGETDDFTIEALSDDSSDRESLSPPHLPPPLLLSLSTTPSPKILMHCSHISRKAFLHIGSLMMRNNTKHPTIITNYYKSSSGTDELKRLK
jgi:hypothetical protein